MTKLRDRINDVVVEYVRESRLGVADDEEVLTDAIISEIKDYIAEVIE
jgi:hypothetical protein